jgi:hypothetical protein
VEPAAEAPCLRARFPGRGVALKVLSDADVRLGPVPFGNSSLLFGVGLARHYELLEPVRMLVSLVYQVARSCYQSRRSYYADARQRMLSCWCCSMDPAPRRNWPTWRQLLTAQAEGIIACDFVHVDLVDLRRVYALLSLSGLRRCRVRPGSLRSPAASTGMSVKQPKGHSRRSATRDHPSRQVTACAGLFQDI